MFDFIVLSVTGVAVIILLIKKCWSDKTHKTEESLAHSSLQIWQDQFLQEYLDKYYDEYYDKKVLYRARTIIDVIRCNMRSNRLQIEATDSQYITLLVRSEPLSDDEDESSEEDLLSEIYFYLRNNELFFKFTTQEGVVHRRLVDLLRNDNEFQFFLNE